MVRFISKWKKDETKEYFVTKTKIKNKGGAEISNITVEKIVEIEIIENQENNYVLQWTEFKTETSFLKEIFRKLFKIRLGETFTIGYTTTKNGIIDELIDTEDLDEQIEKVIEHLKPIGKTETQKIFIEKAFSKETLQAKLLKLMNIFHFPYEEEFSLTEIIEPFEMSNNILTDNKINGIYKNHLIYIDESAGIGEIQIEKKYDQRGLNQAMKKTLENIDQQLEMDRKSQEVPIFVASENYWYKVNFNTGWILEGKYEKAYMGKEEESIERYEFRLIE